ncbi:MAG: NAD(P)-dependent oxidoreductase [Candidatus Bathyarchaeia archaeon]
MKRRKEKVGFIGLGNVGKPMAMNLIKKSYQLTVYDIRPEPIDELAKRGVRPAKSPKEVAENSDIIITSLPRPSDVELVILGINGVLEGAREGCIIIETSTIDPSTIRKVAEEAKKKGVHVLDAPISGGVNAAEKGTLTIMVGGEKQAFEKCRSILKAIGKEIFYVGDVGMGKVYKIATNISASINTLGACEAIIWAVAAKADLKTLYEIMRKSSANSWVLETAISRLIKGDFKPSFALRWMRKDLELALNVAAGLGVPMQLTSLAYNLFTAAKALGLENENNTAVIKVLEKISGITLPLEQG